MIEITQEYVHKALQYYPDTGDFVWNYRDDMPANWNSRWPSQIAGRKMDNGYIQITICYEPILAHRLAWFYVYGSWPILLDHINGDRADNRLANLRICTRAENKINTLSTNCCVQKQRNSYISSIGVDGKRIYLGCFKTEEEARSAYIKAQQEYYGEFSPFLGRSQNF